MDTAFEAKRSCHPLPHQRRVLWHRLSRHNCSSALFWRVHNESEELYYYFVTGLPSYSLCKFSIAGVTSVGIGNWTVCEATTQYTRIFSCSFWFMMAIKELFINLLNKLRIICFYRSSLWTGEWIGSRSCRETIHTSLYPSKFFGHRWKDSNSSGTQQVFTPKKCFCVGQFHNNRLHRVFR